MHVMFVMVNCKALFASGNVEISQQYNLSEIKPQNGILFL